MSSCRTVLFLRSPSIDSPDRYESVFSSAGYNPISIPVLETRLTETTSLARLIQSGPETHSGVIVTSARACEAWKAAVETITPENNSVSWSTVSFYVVGPRTASFLSSLYSVFSDDHRRSLVPSPSMIRGQESGNGDELARFILQDLKTSNKAKKLLYLTGDKNRETLPSILAEGDVELNSLQVYETRRSSTFEADLEKVVQTQPGWWIVFFAPSAAQLVAPILAQYFTLPRIDDSSANAEPIPKKDVRVAAIGPTTVTFLHDTLRLSVSATASKPNPESLLLAIQRAESHLAHTVA
ncbi:Tetrapyrrole biosynthesis, uroporphyrinogen III synthase [Amanita muscaria]